MKQKNKNFYLAVTTLIGTIIGAGIFGIPYVVYQSGIILGVVYLLALGFITILIHLLYGEIVLRTEAKHRLVGYAEKYLGQGAKSFLTLSLIFGLYGSSIAYLILSGEFLNNIFGSFLPVDNPFFFSLAFFSVMAFLVYFGLRALEGGEFLLTVLLLATVILILFLGLAHVDSANFSLPAITDPFIPYGVILFALNGAVAIPELSSILGKNRKGLKKTIVWGTLIPLTIYIIFALVVIGITGASTSTETISGLKNKLGDGIVLLGSLFGFLAIATSFLVVAFYIKETFIYDYKLNNFTAWLLACFVPLAFFLAGFVNFIKIIALVGAIMGGIDSVAIILIYLKAKRLGDRKPEYSLKVPRLVVYLLVGVFIIGTVFSVLAS